MNKNSNCYKLVEEAFNELHAEDALDEVTNEMIMQRYTEKLEKKILELLKPNYSPAWLVAIDIKKFFKE